MAGQDSVAAFVLELAALVLRRDGIADVMSKITERCVEVLSARGAGVLMLSPGSGVLGARTLGCTDPAVEALENLQIELGEGCGIEAAATRQAVEESDIAGSGMNRWPRFAPELIERGVHAVASFPLLHDGTSLGSLDLFFRLPGRLDSGEQAAARTLAAAAAISAMQAGLFQATSQTIDQLEGALSSRMVIEQAKGKLSEQLDLSVDESFQLLRQHARANRLRVQDVAHLIVEGVLHLNNDGELL